MKLYRLVRKCLVLAIMSASLCFGVTMQVGAVSYTTTQIDQIDNVIFLNMDMNNHGQIVYDIFRTDFINYVYLYSEGIINLITTGFTNEVGADLAPSINDNGEIVYRNFDGNSVEIYLYSNGFSRKITDNNYIEGYPDINNSGAIVWAGRQFPNYKIYLYNGENIKEIATISVSPLETDYDGHARINNSGQIVWDSFDGNDYEIYLYSGGIISQISNNSQSDHVSSINNNGDIVWSCSDENDKEIYLYHNGVKQQITNNNYNDMAPSINDKLEIVWRSEDGNKASIYHYYNGTINIVKSYELQPGEYLLSPIINNNGQIAWNIRGNNKATIYLANPNNQNAAVLPTLLLLLE